MREIEDKLEYLHGENYSMLDAINSPELVARYAGLFGALLTIGASEASVNLLVKSSRKLLHSKR